MICGCSPVDMAHLVGKNVSYKKNGVEQNDPTVMEAVVPLCRAHHREYDRNTGIHQRIEFWLKYKKHSIADKIRYKYLNEDDEVEKLIKIIIETPVYPITKRMMDWEKTLAQYGNVEINIEISPHSKKKITQIINTVERKYRQYKLMWQPQIKIIDPIKNELIRVEIMQKLERQL